MVKLRFASARWASWYRMPDAPSSRLEKEIPMSLLNTILGQVAEGSDVQNLAQKVGLSPEQVEQAVTALGQAHASEGDTVQTAAEQTGLPQDKLQEIVGHIGGEGALGRFASMLQGNDDQGSMLSGLKNLL